MLFRQIFDERLAQYAYLIGCQRTGEAIVVDPERDVDRYIEVARAEGLQITAVTETHIHADFLSGARELAEAVGAKVYLSDEGGHGWRYEWAADGSYDVTLVRHGDHFSVGNIDFEVVHTPGHTPEHVTFQITDRGGGATEPMGLLSGDFVFVGDLGRPDLLETAAGHAGAREPAARALHRSAGAFLALPDYLQVWPGHGAGSACGKALGAVPDTTVGYQRRFSPALAAATDSEEAFLEYILSDQPEPPAYFARMKRLNKEGPPLLGALPRPERVGAAALSAAAREAGSVVLDTRRDRAAFFDGHLAGALHTPLDKTFPTVVGSLVDPGVELHLVVEEHELEDAVRALVRIGYDRVIGWAPPSLLAEHEQAGGALASTPRVVFPEVSLEDAFVLDVRGAAEFRETRIPGAVNIAHTRVATRLEELPRDRRILVHCRSGARASAVVPFLVREGFDATLADGLLTDWLAEQPREAIGAQS